MATVSSTLKMFDAMSGPLKNITNSMNLLISTMYKMQNATNQSINMDKTLLAAKQQIAAAEAGIRQAIDQATVSQQRFNQSVHGAQSESGALLASIGRWAKGILAAYATAEGLRKLISATDTFTSTQARLSLIVDKGQTVEQLQKSIFAAAQRSRGDFIALTDNIARMGLLAKDAFANTGEMVAFAELMQKAFKISGASTMEQSAAMYQLSQAMAAGRLQGDEFVSIMENAPMLANAIAKYMGKTKGELKDLASEGKITANIIKASLFSAADDINKKFATMPKTFGDVFQQFKNNAFQAFEPVFKRLTDWLNSAQGSTFINSTVNAFYVAAQAADLLLRTLMWIAGAVQSNWGIIEPILVVIGFAYLPLIIRQIWAMVAALWAAIPPLIAQAIAWFSANWPILLIGAAIGFLVYALYRWSNATSEVIGFVGGLFGVLLAWLYNKFALMANIFLSVAEFFANVWLDPVYATKKLFYDLAISVLQYMENIAKGIENIINKIPGLHVSITSGLSSLLNRLEAARGSLKSETDVVHLMRFQQKDYSEAFNFGQEIGRAASKFVSDKMHQAVNAVSGVFKVPQLDGMQSGIPKLGNIGNVDKVGEVGKIKDTVDISSEDLEVLRDLAEMKSIQNFVTLTPTVQVTTGDIHSGYDIDTIIARIEKKLEEEFAAAAEGVYT